MDTIHPSHCSVTTVTRTRLESSLQLFPHLWMCVIVTPVEMQNSPSLQGPPPTPTPQPLIVLPV